MSQGIPSHVGTYGQGMYGNVAMDPFLTGGRSSPSKGPIPPPYKTFGSRKPKGSQGGAAEGAPAQVPIATLDPFQTQGEDPRMQLPPVPTLGPLPSFIPPGPGPGQGQTGPALVAQPGDVFGASLGSAAQPPPAAAGWGQRPPPQQNPWDPHDYDLMPRPPAENIISAWYPAENNWQACIQKMAFAFRSIHEEFGGQQFDELRVAKEGRAKKAAHQMEEYMYNETGGRVGKQREVKLRTAHVIDLYQDWRFPPDNASWCRGGHVKDFSDVPFPAKWMRLYEMVMDTPYPTVDPVAGAFNPRAGRVYQGALENFYLAAGLQAVGMKPQLIASVFADMQFSDPSLGMFIVRLYKHGQWHHVEIDDALPFDKSNQPMCSSSEFFPNFAWPSLIEKAYAKLHGSWEGLGGGGHIEEVMTDLTGGCCSRYGTTDVAADRLWQYLYELQHICVFGCNINEGECSKRQVPIEKHWASSIFRVAKHDGVPYVCICTAAPTATVRHMPICDVPSPEGYGIHDGFAWLRIDDFTALFDTIYECRLVNSYLGPPEFSGVPYSPGWMFGQPWFEEIWAFQGDVYNENAPSFLIDIYEVPNELTLEVSQTDVRYNDPHAEPENGRGMQAPLLLRFFQCSKEASDMGGGEVCLVHMSAWGHCRDASCAVKVMRPGKYLAMVSLPVAYTSHKMIFRCYSTLPLAMKPVTQHRSWVSVNPARPLDAIPYSLSGFMRVDTLSEKLPQMFDEAEGRGKPMANALLGQTTHKGGARDPQAIAGLRKVMKGGLDQTFGRLRHDHDGLKVVGKFGGRDAVATMEAAETQEGGCSTM